MVLSVSELDAGPVWSVDPTARREPAATEGRSLPVRWSIRAGVVMQDDLHGGVSEVTGASIGPIAAASGEPEPDAVASGWVVPPGGTRVDAIFVLSGTSLGVGRVDRPASPVWLNLDDLVNLDALGDPVDGLTAVEISMVDDRVIGAGWPDDFISAVVEVLRDTAGRATATPGSPAATSQVETTHVETTHVETTHAGTPPAESGSVEAAHAETSPVESGSSGTDHGGSAPAESGSVGAALPDADPLADAPASTTAGRPESGSSEDAMQAWFGPADGSESAAPGSSRELELEDVVYLGGYPGQPKRRKRCTVSMSHNALELRGPGGLNLRIGWESVRSIEVQNSDEARFRMNTKVHRDASAVVLECESDVTLLLEARDCPTLPLRAAIGQLLTDVSVVVV